MVKKAKATKADTAFTMLLVRGVCSPTSDQSSPPKRTSATLPYGESRTKKALQPQSAK